MDVLVYETDDFPDEVNNYEEDPVNEDIDTNSVPVAEALEAFVTVGRETTAESRLNRIAQEITELKTQLEAERIAPLEQQLLALISSSPSTLSSRTGSGAAHDKDLDISRDIAPSLDCTQEFARLEERVTTLEKRLGASAARPGKAPVPLTVQLETMRHKFELLTAQPAHIEEVAASIKKSQLAASIREAPPDNVSRLYEKLQQLDPLVEALPDIVSRLQTLRHLHADFLRRSSYRIQCEHTLAAVRRDIAAWRDTLERIEQKLAITES